jgi:arylsulfatase A-like enzyme
VIVYTSDHGEQFREHGQLGHTGSLFDVEIHVPAWVDAPDGTLTQAERDAVKSHEEDFTFHTDITPTILDLMGLWEAPQLSRYREAMFGRSLLRPGGEQPTLALTNCSGVWGCAFENWGVMRGPVKVISREWDAAWLCYDVRTDPEEQSPMESKTCAALEAEAARTFGVLPGKG